MSEEEYKRLSARPEKGRLVKTRTVLYQGTPVTLTRGRVDPLAGVKAPTKYRNRATGGYSSSKEARHAETLKVRQKRGEISGLREQVPFVLIPRQFDDQGKCVERACSYIADFVFEENGRTVVEDVKSEPTKTAEYRIKKKLMLLVHGVQIREIS